MNGHNLYRRADGVVGVGYVIDHASKRHHSISSPDRAAERIPSEVPAGELERHNIRVEYGAVDAPSQPVDQPTA